MLFLTTISLLASAPALASPVALLQPSPQARFVITFTATSGYGTGATLSLDATQQIATYIGGTARGTVTGQFTLPAGVSATFHSRDYAVSPLPAASLKSARTVAGRGR
ncbi:hypothetical protein GE09DRAFT_1052726 [Coniochaeta sp. 2T2.1]|nr:hypothetical protein GE09DRAFT_1052726 [Coniochaeta sp. 2T2.1]